MTREYSPCEPQAPYCKPLRLPDGRYHVVRYTCPHCGAERTLQNDALLAERGWYTRIGLYRCAGCRGLYTHSS
jgi:hypothetical protein